MKSTIRPVRDIITGQPTSDGAGVKLVRVIGGPACSEFDPFLLLDEFLSDDPNDYIAGFPEHPHRGFETVTYMLAGRMRHGDNQGNSGLLEAGSVQWMTAGRGILHSEMPEQEDGLMWGFQLWVNLPAENKMRAPRYQDIPASDIPEVQTHGDCLVRVIAGTYAENTGPIANVDAEPLYLDIHLPPQTTLEVPVPATHNAFTYCYTGRVLVGPETSPAALDAHRLALLDAGETVGLRTAQDACRVLLVAGRPFDEPVVRYGPFVMNTREEIMTAIDDMRSGRF